MRKHSILTTTALVLGMGVGAVAQPRSQEPTRPPAPVPSPRAGVPTEEPDRSLTAMDEAFARKAAAGGQAEVELAVLAQQKASSDRVKQLAQRTEADHQKANTELMSIADKKGLSIEPKPTADQVKVKTRLEKLSGADFDRAYLETMEKDHQKDIKAFEKQANNGSDPELKAFAANTLPNLKDHLKQTKDAQRALTNTAQ